MNSHFSQFNAKMYADDEFEDIPTDNMSEENLDLINFEFIPNGMTTGLNSEQLKAITQRTMTLTRERDEIIYPEIEDLIEEQEYPELSDEVTAEMNRIENEVKVQTTDQQTKSYSRKFKIFLSSNGKPDNIETMPENVLASYLRFFYSKLKREDGLYYSSSTLVCIRAAIHRFLTQAPVNRNIDILNGAMFKAANNMLRAMVGHFLKSGQKRSEQTSEIEQEDLDLLSDYFDRKTPDRLQKEVWFNTEYYFGMRGRENMRNLSLSTFVLGCDIHNQTYLKINENLLSKNVKASLSATEFTDVKEAKMYEDKTSPNKCPVVAFLLYKRKLEENDIQTMWPKPVNDERLIRKGQWYYKKAVIGKNPLGGMMRTISDDAKLSRRYTNHSIRATVINQLRDKGFRKEQICKITGHKNPRSLESYFRKRSTVREVCHMNKSLHDSLHGASTSSTTNSRLNPELSSELQVAALHSFEDTELDITTIPNLATVRSNENLQEEGIIKISHQENIMVARAPCKKKMKVKCNGDTNTIEIEFE